MKKLNVLPVQGAGVVRINNSGNAAGQVELSDSMQCSLCQATSSNCSAQCS